MAASQCRHRERMAIAECLSKYVYGSQHETYGDVIWVVFRDTTLKETENAGWNTLFGNLTREQANLWKRACSGQLMQWALALCLVYKATFVTSGVR